MWDYNQVSLAWDVPATAVDWYDIEVQDPAGRWNHLRSVYAEEVDMAGFNAATTYYFRVRGVTATFPDWTYSDYSEVINATTDAYRSSPTFTVTDDTSWATAYTNATAGDIIEIRVGTTLAHKAAPLYRAGSGKFVTIRSSAMASLPGFDKRVGPSDTANMPIFRAYTTTGHARAAMQVWPLTHHVTFEGIRFAVISPTTDRINHIINFNGGFEDITNDPYNIEFHRCYVDSPAPVPPYVQTDAGFFSYGADRVVIKDSYLKELTGNLSDTQGIAILRGGEWGISNNHIEGGAENFIAGGSGYPESVGPNLLIFRRNHFFKPLSWHPDEATYDGLTRTIKNLFELKDGIRILLEDNKLENNWQGSQTTTFVLTPRRSTVMTWVKITDLQVRYNHFDKITGLVPFAGDDNYHDPILYPAEKGLENVNIRDNLVENLGWGARSEPTAAIMRITAWNYSTGRTRPVNICFTSNTIVSDYPERVTTFLGLSHSGAIGDSWPDDKAVGGDFIWTSNITWFGIYGIHHDGGSTGVTGLNNWYGPVPSYQWSGNVQMGNNAYNNNTYYPGQYYALNGYADVQFVDSVNGDWRLSEESPYHGIAGADVGAIYTRTQYCESGDWTA